MNRYRSARIIALVDAYDAMTATPPYHSPRTHKQVTAVLNEAGEAQFDPYLRRHFDAMIEN